MRTNTMGSWRWKAAAITGAVILASVLWASGLVGQESLAVQGHGGLAIPTGRFADVTNVGPTMGLQVSYPMTRRMALTVRGDLDQLRGARIGSARAPDMKLWRYGVGVQTSLLGPRVRRAAPGRATATRATQGRWSLLGDVGVGATRFDSDHFAASSGGTRRQLDKTYFETNAGLRLNYDATRRLRLFAATQGNLTFADKGDTAPLAALDTSGRTKPFGSTLTVPVSAGLTLRM